MPTMPFDAPWSATRDALAFGDDCSQTPGPMTVMNHSEDCLFLNVWSPRLSSPNASLPVMVFFYGGSWEYGSDSFPLYNGQNILHRGQKQVVVVTLNYRLGAFGFLASKQLQSLTPDGSTGNGGLQDQRMALRWVRNYNLTRCAAFSGDSPVDPDHRTNHGIEVSECSSSGAGQHRGLRRQPPQRVDFRRVGGCGERRQSSAEPTLYW
jgi:carboxylesterase type B